jgi:glycosyltransferase involved in cell wall biosynthesis
MNSFVYCCRVSSDNKGVENKVMNTVNAVRQHNFISRALMIKENGILGHFLLALKLFTLKEQIVLLRATPFTMILMLPGLLYLRLLKKKIIIDVPTPFINVIQEVKGSNASKVNKFIKILVMFITLPFSLYPAHRVLQYSKEGKWFSFGLKKKILQVGNGIDVKNIPMRRKKLKVQNNTIYFTGVATLAFWHGYDRFITSIYEYKRKNNKYNVIFNIVGDGEEKAKLEKLVNDLSLNDNIIFHGFKDGDDLTKIFDNATHIGVCSLGLFRKNMFYASELKAREYAARGIPFILGCEDFDFPNTLNFVYQCENDDSIIDIDKIIQWYENLDKNFENFSFIREYAIENVDFNSKAKNEILSVL